MWTPHQLCQTQVNQSKIVQCPPPFFFNCTNLTQELLLLLIVPGCSRWLVKNCCAYAKLGIVRHIFGCNLLSPQPLFLSRCSPAFIVKYIHWLLRQKLSLSSRLSTYSENYEGRKRRAHLRNWTLGKSRFIFFPLSSHTSWYQDVPSSCCSFSSSNFRSKLIIALSTETKLGFLRECCSIYLVLQYELLTFVRYITYPMRRVKSRLAVTSCWHSFLSLALQWVLLHNVNLVVSFAELSSLKDFLFVSRCLSLNCVARVASYDPSWFSSSPSNFDIPHGEFISHLISKFVRVIAMMIQKGVAITYMTLILCSVWRYVFSASLRRLSTSGIYCAW